MYVKLERFKVHGVREIGAIYGNSMPKYIPTNIYIENRASWTRLARSRSPITVVRYPQRDGSPCIPVFK